MKPRKHATIRGRMIAIALAATSAIASSAFAQATAAPAADPLAPFKTDKGLISLTKMVPEMTAVSDYKGDASTRTTLFGDFGGSRTRLYEHGLTLDGQLTQVYQGVASGGSASGNGDGRYNGLFEANVTLDTAKAGLWSGGLFIFTEQTSFGNALKDQPGNLSPVNATALWPNPHVPSSELMEYHLIQALPHNTVAILGRADPSNYLDQNSFSSTSDNQFLNVSMNSDPLWGAFITYSSYAALFMTKLSNSVTLAYGAWTPDTAPGDYSGNWHDVGVVLNPQFKYQASSHQGAIQAMLAYSTKDATDLSNPHLLAGVASGNLPTKPSNWLLEIAGEQYFWEPVGASVARAKGGRKEDFQVPTKDFSVNQPGLGLFYRFSYTPEDRNLYNVYASGGLGGRGLLPDRPHDRFGVGLYWLKESGDLEKQLAGNVVTDEVGVNGFYNLAITPYLQFSGDVQWIAKPGKQASDEAWVLGTRLNIRF